MRALPRPSAALSRARPSYSSSPAPQTPWPRPRRTCAATAAPPSAATVNEPKTFSACRAPTGRSRSLRRTGRTQHTPTSAASACQLAAMACGCTAHRSVLRARACAERHQRFKVVGRAGGQLGHGRCRHDGRAQPRAAWAMPRPVERAPASDGADGVGRLFPMRPFL